LGYLSGLSSIDDHHQPATHNDWINTFLTQYKNGGMLPVWELAGNETFCMIGYHSIACHC
jgi:putative alpha-1,2-mannosidase